VNHDELGKLGLSEQDVIDLLAFLETLTDGYQPGRE
jgi:cytochrome c peroxidase